MFQTINLKWPMEREGSKEKSKWAHTKVMTAPSSFYWNTPNKFSFLVVRFLQDEMDVSSSTFNAVFMKLTKWLTDAQDKSEPPLELHELVIIIR